MDSKEPEHTDEEIAVQVQLGNRKSFGILVKRYGIKMMRYAKKFLFGYEDAEDLVQEVFIKAYSNIQSFDTSRKFSSWLYRIAHNEFINAIKKKGKEHLPLLNLDTLFPHPVSGETADREINIQESRQMLNKCLGKLDPKYREPLVLYYFEELSYKEIADILHIPTATVGIRLKRGKQIIKSFYEQQFKKITIS